MRKICLCLVLLGSMAVFVSPVFSQSENHREGRGHGREGKRQPDYAKLKSDLGLTDDQVTQWKNLDGDTKNKLDALRDNSALSEDEKKTQFQQIRNTKETELKKILSPTQYTQFTSNRPGKRDNRK